MDEVIPLAELRTQIDAIDAQILQLLNQRAHCAIEVAKTKVASGEQGCFYRPDREASVLRRIECLNQGPLADATVMRFFRELMSACLALEKPLEIAFLGPAGTFSQQAIFKHFGHAVKSVPAADINEIFNVVESGHCQFGMAPIENSTEGVISHTLDRILASPLKICGEVEIRIHQNLMGLSEDLSGITHVYSHSQSLAQCRRWLDKNLAHAQRVSVSSNAEAARIVASNAQAAAIAGAAAAEVYNLTITAKNIEDEPNNTTRFIIIGEQTAAPTGKDKTSLVISTNNRPGALHKALEPLAKFGVDMLSIESRPSRQGLWDYVFFIDVNGHSEDSNVAQAITLLKDQVAMFKLLGSYPKAVF